MSAPADVTRPATPVAGAGADARRLDRSFMRSIAWSGAGRWVTQLITWPATVVIARLLSPADYGLVVLVRVYIDFIGMLTEAGLGGAVTIAPEMDEHRAGQLHTLSLLMGATAVAVSCLIAAPLGRVYDRPGFEWVVVAMSAIFIIESIGVVPNGLLRREFRYKAIAVADWARGIVDIAVELTLAFLGFGYWTLVAGAIAGAATWQVVILLYRPLRFRILRLRDVRDTLRTMGHMVAQGLANFVVQNSDVMIAGRLATTGAIGAYSFALQLASVPSNKIIGLVANVTPSLFREVRTDLPVFRRYVLLITEATTVVVLPAFIGITLVAGDFTAAVLGPKWTGAVVPLQLLALSAAFKALFAVLPQVLWAVDRGQVVTRYGILTMLVLPPLFFLLGLEYGVNGIAAAWLIGAPVAVIPRSWAACGSIALSKGSYARALWPSVSGVLAMSAAVLAVQALLSGPEYGALIRLGACVAAGAVVYAGAILIFHRARVRTALAALRSARS